MPTVTIEGKQYLVDEGVTADQVAQHLRGPDIGDIAKGFASGVPKGMSGVGNLVKQGMSTFPPLGAALAATDLLAQKATGKNSEEWNNALASKLGLNFQPATTLGQYAKAGGEGVGGTIAGGGIGGGLLATIGRLGLGAGSGVLGEAGEHALGPMGRLAGGLLPGAALGTAQLVANPGGKVFSSAREALQRSKEQLANTRIPQSAPGMVEKTAAQSKIPILGWQAYPPNTAIHNLGQRAAVTEGSAPIQSVIRNQQGPLQDLAAQQPNTSAQTQLINNLKPSVSLQDMDLMPHGPAGGHEMGQIALATELLGEHVPGVRSLLPLGAAGRGFREVLFGNPSRTATNKVYGVPTIEALQTAAQERPRLSALAQILRAYTTPAAQGISGIPTEQK
jgi:hypothetical protein